jgi:hypothetical protein
MRRAIAMMLPVGIGACGGGGTSPPVDGVPVPDAAPAADARDARAWILDHFAGAPVVTGDFTVRTRVETPALVQAASGCCAKYAFDVVEEVEPADPEIGFVDVTIRDLVSVDAYGGGVVSARAPGLTLYLSNVEVAPAWPAWVDYDTTNYDGLVLDESAAIFAEDLAIVDWNADAAIDNKAPVSQFVRLRIEGRGNRAIRYWRTGPHYLVDSQLENAGGLGDGDVMWFADCDATTVRIYGSTFNGSPTVPGDLIGCDNGTAPNLEYLEIDPRTTGEMHEMFAP